MGYFSDERNWFEDARFGMFIHFGLYTLLGGNESETEWKTRKKRRYAALIDKFNPVRFDADQRDATLAAHIEGKTLRAPLPRTGSYYTANRISMGVCKLDKGIHRITVTFSRKPPEYFFDIHRLVLQPCVTQHIRHIQPTARTRRTHSDGTIKHRGVTD